MFAVGEKRGVSAHGAAAAKLGNRRLALGCKRFNKGAALHIAAARGGARKHELVENVAGKRKAP